MPRFDGTGPEGKGPRTGRGAGNCGSNTEQVSNRGYGSGRNTQAGFGRGRGFRSQDQ